MPSCFAAGFWNLLERKGTLVVGQTGALCGLAENPFVFGWIALFWKFPLTASFGLLAKISGKKNLWCGSAVLRSKRRGGSWTGHRWNGASCHRHCCSLPSQAKDGFACRAVLAFLQLDAQPVVSSGSANNYFTSHWGVSYKSSSLTQGLHSLGIEFGWPSCQTTFSAIYFSFFFFFFPFSLIKHKSTAVHNTMNYSVARVTFGWCSVSNTLGPHTE